MAPHSYPQLSLPQITQISPPTSHITKIFINPPQIKLNPHKIHYKTPTNLCFKREKIPQQPQQQPIILSTENSNPHFLSGIFTNMWWANLRSAIGQRFNLEGIIFSTKVVVKHPQLLLPHLKVPDIRYINWEELYKIGFRGVVFDKDNTITLPYSLALWGPLKHSIENCKTVFGDENVAIFSNSVGLYEYDPDETKAKALERELGIRVIRHRLKKPAGSSEEIEKQLNCKSIEVVMVGDRRFTDIVFGNRNGFFTVFTEPLTSEGENLFVRMVRKVEDFVVENRFRRGLKAKDHCLLANCEVNVVCLSEPL